MQDVNQNNEGGLNESELNQLIAPEIKGDALYALIEKLAATENIQNVLEIGSSAGGGSTEAFVAGLSKNSGSPKLFCIEVSKPRFNQLRATYEKYPFVHCYNRSSVRVEEFPSAETVRKFYHAADTGLRKFPLDQVLGWLRQDIEYVREAGVEAGAIESIKGEHGIETFDMVLIDGSEFTGEVEYNKIKGARLILLDDTTTFKCWTVRQILLADPMYDLIADDQSLRNGYSAFRRRLSPRRVGADALPIHFFTIVLNGEPFIRYHEKIFSQLNIPWHWHVVEGVAALNHDTAWSVATGGRVADSVHEAGRSNDGTSAYLDGLARRFPDNVSIYRKPLGEFWDGKKEMVNAPLPHITEPCLLWQIDNDELWTLQQIETVHDLFVKNPDRSAAYYWCWYFVGPDKIISTRYNYAQNPNQEWLRTWRFSPGAIWAAHEPPILVSFSDDGLTKTDIAKIKPFTQDEMEQAGVVFQHFAYATEDQLNFKELYYGYPNARSQWRSLQQHQRSGALRDFFGWVSDETMFDDIVHYPVLPLAEINPSTKDWIFPDQKQVAHAPRARPRVIIDGIFWQYLSSGIGRVWENILKEWVKSGFAGNVIVLDRGGTAPKIPGIHYWTIARHDYKQTGGDSLYLERVCRQFDAEIFVSTYYSTPTRTPSFFFGYDMIPEVLGLSLEDETWREKRRAIIHAAQHSMISQNSADDLERIYPGLPKGGTRIIHVAVSPEFSPASKEQIQVFRNKYQLGERPYLLMVGERIGYGGYKNGELVFRALASLPSEIDFVLFCVGGQSQIEANLASLAPRLETRCEKLNDDDLRAAYSGALALLYSSKYEGFGMPPLESMACGTPAIVCRNSSLPEVVGNAAIFVDDRDPSEMADAVMSLFRSDVRERLALNGLKRSKDFSFEKTAEKLASALMYTVEGFGGKAAAQSSDVWNELRTMQQEFQSNVIRAHNVNEPIKASVDNGADSPRSARKRLSRIFRKLRHRK